MDKPAQLESNCAYANQTASNCIKQGLCGEVRCTAVVRRRCGSGSCSPVGSFAMPRRFGADGTVEGFVRAAATARRRGASGRRGRHGRSGHCGLVVPVAGVRGSNSLPCQDRQDQGCSRQPEAFPRIHAAADACRVVRSTPVRTRCPRLGAGTRPGVGTHARPFNLGARQPRHGDSPGFSSVPAGRHGGAVRCRDPTRERSTCRQRGARPYRDGTRCRRSEGDINTRPPWLATCPAGGEPWHACGSCHPGPPGSGGCGA